MATKRRKTKQGDSDPSLDVNCPPETDSSQDLVKLFNRLQMDDMSTGPVLFYFVPTNDIRVLELLKNTQLKLRKIKDGVKRLADYLKFKIKYNNG
jgi:hypothetical protein